MAALDLVTQLYVDGAWTTYDSYTADGWRTRVGPDLEAGLTPNLCEFTLASPDLSMDPSNAESPLYGKIGPNTGCRIRINSASLVYCEASSWRPDRTIDHRVSPPRGRSWVTLTGEGLLRRLGRWEDPLDSPMRRQIASYDSLLGHWPLEDPSGSATLAQTVAGLAPGAHAGSVTLAGDDGPGGSAGAVVIGSGGQLSGRFAPSGVEDWQVCFAVKLDAVPGSGTYETMFEMTDSVGRTWAWQVNDTTFKILVTAGDGSTVEDSGAVTFGTGISITEWVRYRIKTTESGGTVTYEPSWYMQDDASPAGFTGTFSSTRTGYPRSWRITGNTHTDGAAYCHVFALSDTSVDLTGGTDARRAFDGYLGERAGWRFIRLMAENGLQAYIAGDADLSTPMGRQRPARLLDLLDEIVKTDGALIYDEPLDQSALTIRLHNNLINQTAALEIDWSDLVPPLGKNVDDVGTVNDVTVSNWDGSEARVEAAAGPRSVQVPPGGVGRYRKTVDVSMQAASHLPSRAGWELANGTLDRPRYPQLRIDLTARPALRSTVTNLRPGHIVELSGVEPDPVPLRVLTIERAGDGVRDVATLSCTPADIWLPGEYDDDVHRYDSRSTDLKAGVTSSATSLAFRTTDPGDAWSTTSVPYDVIIAGERITVTAMTAADTNAELVAGHFEDGVGAWTVRADCTFVQSSAFAQGGTYSGLLTVTGSPAQAYVRPPAASCPRVAPGAQVQVSLWVRSTSALTDVRATIDWLDADGDYLGTADSGSAGLASGSWVQRTVTATAPTGAAYAQYGPTILSSPSAGTVLYVDNIAVLMPGYRFQTATVTRSVNGVTKAQAAAAAVHVANPGRWALGDGG